MNGDRSGRKGGPEGKEKGTEIWKGLVKTAPSSKIPESFMTVANSSVNAHISTTD